MLVSDYFDSIENTEDEAVFLSGLYSLLEKDIEDIRKAENIPIIGKLIKAMLALSKSESIHEFRQSEHYVSIKDWSIKVYDLEKGYINFYPGPKHLKKIFTVIAIVIGIICIIKLCKKCRAK